MLNACFNIAVCCLSRLMFIVIWFKCLSGRYDGLPKNVYAYFLILSIFSFFAILKYSTYPFSFPPITPMPFTTTSNGENVKFSITFVMLLNVSLEDEIVKWKGKVSSSKRKLSATLP